MNIGDRITLFFPWNGMRVPAEVTMVYSDGTVDVHALDRFGGYYVDCKVDNGEAVYNHQED